MTHRQRLLAALRGQSTDRLPWAPRMDLWYLALRAADALPPRFVGMNTAEIADELEVGCHAVRADYTLSREPFDLALRALGFDNHPDYPCRIKLRRLRIDFHHDGGQYDTTIHTSKGQVNLRFQLTPQMLAKGISLPFVQQYPIRSPADYDAVAEVFEHLEVIPTPQSYAEFQQRIGERGLAVANGPLGCTPVHLLLHDLMPMPDFFVYYREDPDRMRRFAQRLAPFYEALFQASLASRAEVIFWGANYDRDITWPPFFQNEIMPALRDYSNRAHAAGKLLLTHTDGENRDLLPLYADCRFDCGESVCPAPMTSCTLAEIRRGMGSETTVWGGIPCVVLLDSVMDERGFEDYLDALFSELGDARRLILGVSDNVPADANLTRLDRVKTWIDAVGPVSP